MALIERLKLKNFRNYEMADVSFGPSITVVYGENGAGKTSLIEALYFALLGRSCRTSRDREVVRFGSDVARLEVFVSDGIGNHVFAVGSSRGSEKKLTFDDREVERFIDIPQRPLIATFFPDRLALLKGAPALRRAHLDQLVSALWPARASNRKRYVETLSQRNALLGRVQAGFSSQEDLDIWDRELAKHGLELMSDRAEATELLEVRFSEVAKLLGVEGDLELAYKPRVRTDDLDRFMQELKERRSSDIERGYTGYGPHRDDLGFVRDGREMKTFGSQGEQRITVLCLLLAERYALGRQRSDLPVLLLDDVMSELDSDRRQNLIELLMKEGQTIITATETAHIPLVESEQVATISVTDGVAHCEALSL